MGASVEARHPHTWFEDPYGCVTTHQLRVVTLASDGFSNAEIGAKLHISKTAVAMVLWRLCQHTGTRNRTEAVAWCLRNRLIN